MSVATTQKSLRLYDLNIRNTMVMDCGFGLSFEVLGTFWNGKSILLGHQMWHNWQLWNQFLCSFICHFGRFYHFWLCPSTNLGQLCQPQICIIIGKNKTTTQKLVWNRHWIVLLFFFCFCFRVIRFYLVANVKLSHWGQIHRCYQPISKMKWNHSNVYWGFSFESSWN